MKNSREIILFLFIYFFYFFLSGLLDFDKLSKRFFIEMKKTSDNLYILEDVVIREEDISEKKHTIEEITETAKHLQPVGNTLNSNMMNIKQPFLLKFKLREYQLIGMNWLFTLSQKKMNGKLIFLLKENSWLNLNFK